MSKLKWIEIGMFIQKLNKEIFLLNQWSFSNIELTWLFEILLKNCFYDFYVVLKPCISIFQDSTSGFISENFSRN